MSRPFKLRQKALSTIAILLTMSAQSLAEDVVQKAGDQCPRGYRDGPGKYCYSSNSFDTGEKVVEKARGECPSGYRDGKGQYCYGNGSDKDVIVKSGDRCPRGYRDGRGHYCYR